MKQVLSYALELAAFALIGALVAAVAGPVWALIPVAIYLVIAAVALRGRGR